MAQRDELIKKVEELNSDIKTKNTEMEDLNEKRKAADVEKEK